MFTTWHRGELREIYDRFEAERVEPCITGFEGIVRATLDEAALIIRDDRHNNYSKEKDAD